MNPITVGVKVTARGLPGLPTRIWTVKETYAQFVRLEGYRNQVHVGCLTVIDETTEAHVPKCRKGKK